MIEELLHWMGLPGSIIAIVSTGIMLYHAHEVIGFLSRLGTWLRIGGVLTFLGVLAAAGVIPGVKISTDLRVVWNGLVDVLSWLPIKRLPDLIPI